MEKAWKDGKVHVTACRFFNVYGERQDPKSPYSGVISKFLDCANLGLDLPVFGDGGATRDFIYVGDIAKALVEVISQEPSEENGVQRFNIGTETVTSVKTLAETIISVVCQEKSGPKPSIVFKDPRPGDIEHSLSNSGAIEAELGFSPKTSLQLKTQAWLVHCLEPKEVTDSRKPSLKNPGFRDPPFCTFVFG
jgi:nucleoside-diphosphate-sugar epimerase